MHTSTPTPTPTPTPNQAPHVGKGATIGYSTFNGTVAHMNQGFLEADLTNAMSAITRRYTEQGLKKLGVSGVEALVNSKAAVLEDIKLAIAVGRQVAGSESSSGDGDGDGDGDGQKLYEFDQQETAEGDADGDGDGSSGDSDGDGSSGDGDRDGGRKSGGAVVTNDFAVNGACDKICGFITKVYPNFPENSDHERIPKQGIVTGTRGQ